MGKEMAALFPHWREDPFSGKCPQMVCSDLRSHSFTFKLVFYIIAQIGTRKKALPRNARGEPFDDRNDETEN